MSVNIAVSNGYKGFNMKKLSSQALAFLGDAVYELMVRERIADNIPLSEMHELKVRQVCAQFQSAAVGIIEPYLTDTEMAVYKRGRNTKVTVPKTANVSDYRRATGLECLFGYLHSEGLHERKYQLFEFIADSYLNNVGEYSRF
jgi:ribonuclease-3 family protein